jgi:hypothetical protein
MNANNLKVYLLAQAINARIAGMQAENSKTPGRYGEGAFEVEAIKLGRLATQVTKNE